MPVDEVVIGELGMVGNVREVLEHLLARARDRG
jgi:predicted ATP-dependent serine protease